MLLSLPTIRDVEDIKSFKEKAATCTDEVWVRATIQKLMANGALSLLKMFPAIPEDLQESIFASDQSAVQYIKNPTKSVLQKYLTLNPFMVSQYSDIDEELLKHLYSKNGLLVRKAPTTNLECQRAAVKNEPLAILYLKDSEIFEELLLSAIIKTPDIIKFFPNADNSFWNKAIYRNPYLIRYKSNPTKWQKETAITKNPAVVYSIKDAKKEDFALARSLLKKYRQPVNEQVTRTENEQFNPFARM